MKSGSTSLLTRFGFRVRAAGSTRSIVRRPRLAAERIRDIGSPRRAWLVGIELRPKTVPLRRLG